MAKQNASQPSALERRIQKNLASQDKDGLRRVAPNPTNRRGIYYELDQQPVISFCSNDYLGLAAEPETPNLVPKSTGSAASPLVSGYQPELRAAEASVATIANSEAALLLTSGYQANIAAIPTLIGTSDRVFSDVLNHGSIIDGVRLSRPAELILQSHTKTPSLSTPNQHGIDWWITESTFSMDGDGPTQQQLRDHLKVGGHLIFDCSHDVAIRDPIGELRRTYAGQIIQIFGLGKAPGIFGGAITGNQTIIDWIRTNSRAYIFSTAMSPAHATQVRHRMENLSTTKVTELREKLRQNTEHMKNRLREIGYARADASAPIFPLIIGDNHHAVEAASQLKSRGWHVQAIRPPTVAVGQSRLRITVSSLHTSDHIEAFTADLKAILLG